MLSVSPKKISSLILVLISGLFIAAHVSADSPSFSLSPVKTFVDLHRGQAREGVFQVRNQRPEALPLTVMAQFFGVKDEYGSIDFRSVQGVAAEENPNSWLKLDTPFLLLGPGETRNIPYSLKVPQNAPLGTFTFSAVFRAKFPETSNEGAYAQTLPAIGSLFFLNVVPKEGEMAEIKPLDVEDFAVKQRNGIDPGKLAASISSAINLPNAKYVEESPVLFTVKLKNPGSYAARPLGSLEITDLFGRQISRTDFPEGVILPQLARAYSIVAEKPDRLASMKLLPAFVKKSFLPGRYKANLVLSSGLGIDSKTVTKTLYFWAFPKLFTLSTILALLTLVFVLRYRGILIKVLKDFIYG
jgi:hypothetical protein